MAAKARILIGFKRHILYAVLEWIVSDVPGMFLVPHWEFICSSTSLHPSSKYQEPGSHVVADFVALVMEHGAQSDPCRESNSRFLTASALLHKFLVLAQLLLIDHFFVPHHHEFLHDQVFART